MSGRVGQSDALGGTWRGGAGTGSGREGGARGGECRVGRQPDREAPVQQATPARLGNSHT